MCLAYAYRVTMVKYIAQIAVIQDPSILLLYIEDFACKHRWGDDKNSNSGIIL